MSNNPIDEKMILDDGSDPIEPVPESRELELLFDDIQLTPFVANVDARDPKPIPVESKDEASKVTETVHSGTIQLPTSLPNSSERDTNSKFVRRTDLFRTQDRIGRTIPVCFHCKQRGHVKRYCPQRSQQSIRRVNSDKINNCKICGDPCRISLVCRHCCHCH